MLADPRFVPLDLPAIRKRAQECNLSYRYALRIMSPRHRKIETGIYGGWIDRHHIQNRIFNIHSYVTEVGIGKAINHPLFQLGEYGTADNLEQIKHHYRKLINYKTRRYFITVSLIKNDNDGGGFRWHKNGQYIGKYKNLGEYLWDSPEIKEVYSYQIYQLLD